MNEFVSTISGKGQIMISAAVRRRLGVDSADKVALVLTEAGTVKFRYKRGA